jgi:uncharacterized repeat protein (TIGR01451 family)
MIRLRVVAASLAAAVCVAAVPSSARAVQVTYQPYIQPGDASGFSRHDLMVIAWQTDERSPSPDSYRVSFGRGDQLDQQTVAAGRVVNDYLSADPALPHPPNAPGAHVNYHAVLSGLEYATTYSYRVTGPGLPAEGFSSSFRTRTRSGKFSFQVMGDEGFFPSDPAHPPYLANLESRIVHTMFNADRIALPDGVRLPRPDLALNTGDNVYNAGSEGSYRDFWMPVWNSDVDSNESGAPFVRSIPYYIVGGNHDFGGTGDFVNLLAADRAGPYSGNLDGGDALQYFNNYYFPLNGPVGVDSQYIFNHDSRAANGFYFRYQGKSYSSPAAIEAFRASTAVDSGGGTKRQIDRMSNYSFDYGNAHFIFLDANPHLFNAIVDYSAFWQAPQSSFPEYPSILRDWIVNDLDGSDQPWKIAVFHQPVFSSGHSGGRNNQMRRVIRFLQDHGVNLVFNGHEHNYQRTLPLRALEGVAAAPTTAGAPVVELDSNFDGLENTVPDGVIYLVEGAGGDKDFDNNLPPPRGSGSGADQDDSATGTFTYAPGETYSNGPASWLDTHLTDVEMSKFYPGAGTGPKITALFKAKLFSFGQAVVDGNELTFYQVSEPLLPTSSATASNPAPYGTDASGRLVNDPIPDTLVDPATGKVVTAPAAGPSALLDLFRVTRPDLGEKVEVKLERPEGIRSGDAIAYRVRIDNRSEVPLNGAQVVVTLPKEVSFAGALDDRTTLHGRKVVITLGRLMRGASVTIDVSGRMSSHASGRDSAKVLLRTSTAQTVGERDEESDG